MIVLVVLAVLAELVAGCSLGAPDEDQLLGRWRVVSVADENGRSEPVAVGVNTTRHPSFTFERRDGEYLVGGSLGCNTLESGVYTLDGDELSTIGGLITEMGCEIERDGVPDEAAAMWAEERILAVLGAGGRTVELEGDDRATMKIRSAGGEIVLERVGAAPGTEAPPVGPLECSDGVKASEHLVGSGLSQAEAARAAEPAVVRTDNNLYTTYGFAADGTMIVEVQNTDSGIGDYLVYTCSDE